MRDDFLRDSLPLLEKNTELYILWIERFPLYGIRELLTVCDRVYPDVSAFVYEYMCIRQLIIYFNCQKFYRRSVIEKCRLRFDENMDFGEDRLFNFRYLSDYRERILISSLIMFRYIQLSIDSISSINRLIFGESGDGDDVSDVLIVLGSRNCEYKIRRTLEIGRRHQGVLYIVAKFTRQNMEFYALILELRKTVRLRGVEKWDDKE